MKPPNWMIENWSKIFTAAKDLGQWFEDYSGGFESASDISSDFPFDLPEEIYELDLHNPWKGPSYEVRTDWMEEGKIDVPVLSFNFGTFQIFRVTNSQLTALDVDLENPNDDNERKIADGQDHVIILYMK